MQFTQSTVFVFLYAVTAMIATAQAAPIGKYIALKYTFS